MLLGLRKILFYIFFTIYIVLCPIIIIRMLGFVIHPSTHQLVKTGLCVVHSDPVEAEVFMDGRQAHDTPTTIRDLIPGVHFLRIRKNGFEDLTLPVTITPGEATVLTNLKLMPQ